MKKILLCIGLFGIFSLWFRFMVQILTLGSPSLTLELNKYPSDLVQKATITVCAVVRNGRELLLPWLLYHRELGISHFYLYDNNDDGCENVSLLLRDVSTDFYTVIAVQGPLIEGRQIELYRDCRQKNQNSDWLIQLDIDEMVVLKRGYSDLKQILFFYWQHYKHLVSLRWQYTCTWNRVLSYNLFCERPEVNIFDDSDGEVKSFYRPRSFYTRHSVHHMGTLDMLKVVVDPAIMSIYHFYARSLEDFMAAKFMNQNDWQKANFDHYRSIAWQCNLKSRHDRNTSLDRSRICEKIHSMQGPRQSCNMSNLHMNGKANVIRWLRNRILLNDTLSLAELPEGGVD